MKDNLHIVVLVVTLAIYIVQTSIGIDASASRLTQQTSSVKSSQTNCGAFCDEVALKFVHSLQHDIPFCCTVSPDFKTTDIKTIEQLGKGTYGTVYRVSLLTHNDKPNVSYIHRVN